MDFKLTLEGRQSFGDGEYFAGTIAMGGGAIDELTEDEKRALRGSKFAPLTSLPSSSRSQLPRF